MKVKPPWILLTMAQWAIMGSCVVLAYTTGLTWWSLLALPGVLLHAWAVKTLKVGLSGINHGTLVTNGPFAWWRHPMYLGELLTLCGLAAGTHSLWIWMLIGLLAPILLIKAIIEERELMLNIPHYAEYKRQSAILIPGCW